ncbi:MAG: helix-turn-helix transcriptional regulator [Thermodesulfobacteriota bacterium]
MESFGEALRKARKARKVTLRHISQHVGKSIGYLSDVERGRKRPPNLDTVGKLEEILQVRDQTLVRLAAKLRQRIPEEVMQKLRMTPRLSEALLRADKDLTDDEFEEVLSHIRKMKQKRGK